jgi:hypothetical protein
MSSFLTSIHKFIDATFGECESCVQQKDICYHDIQSGFLTELNYETYVFRNLKKCTCEKFLNQLQKYTHIEKEQHYYIYKEKTGAINVSKDTFRETSGKVVAHKHYLVKYPHGLPKKQTSSYEK